MPSAFKVSEKPAKITISSAVAIQVRRGRRPTPPASFDQIPESRSSTSSSAGTFGQKTQRPGGNFWRLKGPQLGRVMRKIPKTTQQIMVIVARTPPTMRNGPIAISVMRLRMSPTTAGTINASIGRTTLGMISRAGRKVNITNSAATIPAAPTGPSDRFEFSSLSSRHINPMMTVAPLATIGSTTPRSAARIASACCT